MNTRTRPLALALGILVVVASACSSGTAAQKSLIAEIQQRGSLKVGVAEAKPFSYKDGDTWSGIFIDPLKDWATSLEVDVEFVPTTWENIVAGLQAHQYDVAAALNARPSRANTVTFSEPLMQSRGVYYVDPARTPARTWTELNDPKYSVCVSQGSAEDLALTNLNPDIEITRLPDNDACSLALLSGQVDAWKGDWTGAGTFLSEHDNLGMIIPDPAQNGEGICYAIPFGYNYDDVQALNVEIDSYIQRGLLDKTYRDSGFIDPEPWNITNQQ